MKLEHSPNGRTAARVIRACRKALKELEKAAGYITREDDEDLCNAQRLLGYIAGKRIPRTPK